MRTVFPQDQLTAAITGANSWRQVNTRLGRAPEASPANLKVLAGQYGIDVSHLGRKKRSYTDDQLRTAVSESSSWAEVATLLGKNPRSGAVRKAMRSAAEAIQLNVQHLERRRAAQPETGCE